MPVQELSIPGVESCRRSSEDTSSSSTVFRSGRGFLVGFLPFHCSLICFVGTGVADCSVCLGLDVVLTLDLNILYVILEKLVNNNKDK